MALFTTALGLYGGVLWIVDCGAVSSRDSLHIKYQMMHDA
jgi:hypothetical protein